MALFRLPFEDRNPLPGEKGQVILVDLREGRESIVAETCGWESQVGANVQWGKSDCELFYIPIGISRADGLPLIVMREGRGGYISLICPELYSRY